jgi:hypothetical protein
MTTYSTLCHSEHSEESVHALTNLQIFRYTQNGKYVRFPLCRAAIEREDQRSEVG